MNECISEVHVCGGCVIYCVCELVVECVCSHTSCVLRVPAQLMDLQRKMVN